MVDSDFPSLVNSTKNTQIWERGYENGGYASIDDSVSPIISVVRTS